jgi:hypothetical protein
MSAFWEGALSEYNQFLSHSVWRLSAIWRAFDFIISK